MKIVITGSVAYDYLMTFPGLFQDHLLVDRLDRISLSFLVDTMVRQQGGCAPNIAYALALLGERPVLMATVGQDFSDYHNWLEQHGIDTSAIKIIPNEFTASFFANTDTSNAQIASFYTGAMAYAHTLSFANLSYKPDLVVISPNDPRAMVNYPVECKKLGIPYLYDPSQQLPRLNGEELKTGADGAFALFVNDYEFGMIQEKTGLDEDTLLEKVKLLVVTHGEKGAKIYTDGQVFDIPIVTPKQIVDPTGVGDAFRGGFLAGYSHGLSWPICGRVGALAATYCLEAKGGQTYHFTPAEFVARYEAYFEETPELHSAFLSGEH